MPSSWPEGRVMYLSEPTTTLTDYLLAVASFGFALSMRRLIAPRNRLSAWYWCAAFVASSVAAILGGTFHGFVHMLDGGTLRAVWNATMFSIGACAALMTAGVRSAALDASGDSKIWLTRGVVITFVGLLFQQSRFPQLPHFNYNDLYHLIQLVALYCFFRCARTLRDRPAGGTAPASL